jgi:hypothetical protein
MLHGTKDDVIKQFKILDSGISNHVATVLKECDRSYRKRKL